MTEIILPIAFTLFVWWFSTGVILFLDGLPVRTFRWSMIGATVLLVASFWGLWATRADTSISGAYWAFTCGLLAWGWQQISFYMGAVTGPRREACREGCSGWRHFGHAIQTSLYHELAIIVAAVAVFWLTWGQPNQVGTWTFMILWWMHQSAKLNVFLGVRNLNVEFLPDHLGFLRGFLTEKPMNLLFPVSVSVSTVTAVLLVMEVAAADATPFEVTGFTFLATMMILAILEHWFLVLPLPAAALWKWGLASRRATQPVDVEVVAGFLGAGKTTYLRRMLADADPPVSTVVLVNDFASVGVDGSLLSAQGADVIELPDGCICCSLRSDLSQQLAEAITRWSPGRVLIEPSGVADIAALVTALNQPNLKPLVRSLNLTCILDAGAFLADFARMPAYFEAQARLANKLVVNKCELVNAAERDVIEATLRGLNPSVEMVGASFGVVQERLPARRLSTPKPRAHHIHPDGQAAHDDERHQHAEPEAIAGLTAWSASLDAPCDATGLESVLSAVVRGDFGQIERMKGIARVGAGWIRFDVAGGRPRMAAFAPGNDEQPRVVAIGRSLRETSLRAAFKACGMATAA